ncbi:hypothetical protein QJS10_CPA05g00410 [Acorus calamus]|uniref:ditrans,polycis-polyprenyl diphosphate synthase [(2E,6E)-farnesyldiphosphate specific] n=1 Tax=Acorus calamus TaxID=4465 RepID=A0AAV9EQM6_ACOCL|nr:hypothetical protein QJS10_CPA05g00410 [Acorus calamus]
MDSRDKIPILLTPQFKISQRSGAWMLLSEFCWHLLHFVVHMVHIVSRMVDSFQFYFISSGLLREYDILQVKKLCHLAIIFDSEEAHQTSKIGELMSYLLSFGVKHISLYDMEGVLKQSNEMELILKRLNDSSLTSHFEADANPSTAFLDKEKMKLELLSFSDGKEGVAKAASLLYSKYLTDVDIRGHQIEPRFTEADVDGALRSVGCEGPEPDLLLIVGPARCSLGFPAWRMRYTEIVHIGPLRSVKYGAIVKAIYDFSKKHQNYGS